MVFNVHILSHYKSFKYLNTLVVVVETSLVKVGIYTENLIRNGV